MNITIDTGAAQKSAALSSAKMSGVAKTAEKSAAQTAKTSGGKYDTLELSESAVQYLSNTDAGSSAQTDTAAGAAELASGTDSQDSSVDADTLYSYTDEQLDELLANGRITQLEYNNEMAKRTSAETE